MNKSTRALLKFLDNSPTPYHAVANVSARLADAGYRRLEEGADWDGLEQGKYLVTRNDSW